MNNTTWSVCQVSAATAQVVQQPEPAPEAEIEIADVVRGMLQRHYGADVIHDEGAFWAWNGRFWFPLSKEFLRSVTLRAFSPAISHGKTNTVISILGATRRHAGFFQGATRGIPAADGFVVFEENGTPSLRPHAPEHRNRYILEGRVRVTNAKRELLKALFEGSFKDDPESKEKVLFLTQVMGVTALGAGTLLKQPKCVVLLGNVVDRHQTTMTGKSQFLECLRGLVPEEARSNLSIAQIAGDYGRFVPRLVGKVLVASDEMPTRAEFLRTPSKCSWMAIPLPDARS